MKTFAKVPSVALLCLLAIACRRNADTASPDVATPAAAGTVSFADAVAAASAEVPEGVPYEVEWESLDGKDVIEVEFLIGAAVREVYIDPASGAVVEVRDEPADHTEQSEAELQTQSELMGDAKLSLADAAAAASEHGGGEAREVEFKVIEGTLVAEVQVATTDGTTVVLLNAATGDVVED